GCQLPIFVQTKNWLRCLPAHGSNISGKYGDSNIRCKFIEEREEIVHLQKQHRGTGWSSCCAASKPPLACQGVYAGP
ncbi:unnamed protein product, partial [Staurois parvus]